MVQMNNQFTIKAFSMSETEVTFVQWDACYRAGGCSYKPKDRGWGRDNRPVVYVSWNHTKEYISWLNKKTGETYRLPSEGEWEYTARAGSTTKYSWGNRIDCSKARYGYYTGECGGESQPLK